MKIERISRRQFFKLSNQKLKFEFYFYIFNVGILNEGCGKALWREILEFSRQDLNQLFYNLIEL